MGNRKVSKFHGNNGKESMGRWLVYWAAKIGWTISLVCVIMLLVSFFYDRIEWAPWFVSLCIAGLGEAGLGITGKTLQRKYERTKNNGQEEEEA
jgi:hypothetical protein